MRALIVSDIDGVLFDFIGALRARLKIRFGWAPALEEFCEYDVKPVLREHYCLSESDAERLKHDLEADIVQEDIEPLYPHVVEAFGRFALSEDCTSKGGTFLHFVTARHYLSWSSFARFIRECIPVLNDLPFTVKYQLTSKEKVDVAADLARLNPSVPVIFIDDQPNAIELLLDRSKNEDILNLFGLCPRRPWNENDVHILNRLAWGHRAMFYTVLTYAYLIQCITWFERELH